MSDEQKVKYLNTLEKLRQSIGGCFGSEDGIFAGHPADEERAKVIRKDAEGIGVRLVEMQELVLGYLYRRQYQAEHIKTQTDAATKFFEKKLK
ncbi:hypothetical protein [Flavihumibacter sp.]|uniref:hypothetical protein n=1 Tax=Flavihumibacter sp. TaxID=1913981 RepID=UPI002FC926B3